MPDLNKATRRATHDRRSHDSDTAWAEGKRARDAARAVIAEKPLPELLVTTMVPGNVPFVCDTWARTFLHSDYARSVPDDVYKVEHRGRIARLLRRSITLCLVSKDSPDFVSGYVVFEPPRDDNSLPILHWLLVHSNIQGRGYGNQLFKLVAQTKNSPDDPVWATHWTQPMRRISEKWGLLYNPYLLEVLEPVSPSQPTLSPLKKS